MPQSASARVALYASVGPELTHYDVDVEAAALVRRGTVALPANVHYAWPHASGRYLYVASSDSAPGAGAAGDRHHVTAFRIDPAWGALTPHGQSIPLPTRPIHMTTDIPSEHLLVAFSNPSASSPGGASGWRRWPSVSPPRTRSKVEVLVADLATPAGVEAVAARAAAAPLDLLINNAGFGGYRKLRRARSEGRRRSAVGAHPRGRAGDPRRASGDGGPQAGGRSSTSPRCWRSLARRRRASSPRGRSTPGPRRFS